eukprot:g3408.t1
MHKTKKKSGTIAVAIRLRPLSKSEEKKGLRNAWNPNEDGTKMELAIQGQGKSPKFKFKAGSCFASSATTDDVYQKIGKPIVEACMSGINGTIMAYGQTSSGKTHTMIGSYPENPGIALLSVIDAFQFMRDSGRDYLLRVSMCEIYNEVVRDLFNTKNKNLKVFGDPIRGSKIAGITIKTVTSTDQVFNLLFKGFANRSTGKTKMNENSSRSHTVFQLHVQNIDSDAIDGNNAESEAPAFVSTLNLVDLAGSERTMKVSAGKASRMKEGININRSLLTLGKVIQKLVNEPKGHIPYRDSQLTRILAKSLGGNAQAAVICTLAPSDAHVHDTKGTLYFASNACRVKTHARVNKVAASKTMIGRHADEVKKLKSQLKLFRNPLEMMSGQEKDAESAARAAMNDIVTADAKKAIAREAEAQAALRKALEKKLEHLTNLVISTEKQRAIASATPMRKAWRDEDDAMEKAPSKVGSNRQTWGPGYWGMRLNSQQHSLADATGDHDHDDNAGPAEDNADVHGENIDIQGENLPDALAELAGMLEGEQQAHLEAESRCAELESLVSLLMDGCGLEEKTFDELDELKEVYLQGLARIADARIANAAREREEALEKSIAELEKAHAEQVEAMRCKFEKQIGALEQENESLRGDVRKTKQDLQSEQAQATERAQRALKTEIRLRARAHLPSASAEKVRVQSSEPRAPQPLQVRNTAFLNAAAQQQPSPFKTVFAKALHNQ